MVCYQVTRDMEAGIVQLISHSRGDWQAGYIAAMTDDAPFYPPDIRDHLAFWAGFTAGRAARQRAIALSPANE